MDYLTGVQMAAQERQQIERQYDQRVNNNMMLQTSRLLARLSSAAGFVYTSNVKDQCVQRLDIRWLGCAVGGTGDRSGIVRH